MNTGAFLDYYSCLCFLCFCRSLLCIAEETLLHADEQLKHRIHERE